VGQPGPEASTSLVRVYLFPRTVRDDAAQKVVASRLCDLRASTSKSGKQTAFAVRLIQWQTSEHPNITSSRARA
jgi:hypothetical protein